MATKQPATKRSPRSSAAERTAVSGKEGGSTPPVGANKKGEATKKLEAYGIDAICEDVIGGEMLTDCARRLGVGIATLLTWINADPERSARAREARRLSAHAHEERAHQGIEDAKDPFELARAKELAHHIRWKASMIAPREFGAKLALGGSDDLPPLKGISDEQLERRIQALQEKLNGNPG